MYIKTKSVFLILCLLISSVSYVLLADDNNFDNEYLENEEGLVIIKVIPDSPADKAGIKRGDILLAIDGQAVYGFNDVYNLLTNKKIGESAELEIRHGDNKLQKTIVLEEKIKKKAIGLVFAPQYHQKYNKYRDWRSKYKNLYKYYKENDGEANGVIITKVIKNSPADKAGIQSGDLIIAINDDKIDSENRLRDIVAAYKPDDEISVRIYTENGTKDVLVVLAEKEQKSFLGVYYYELPGIQSIKEYLGKKHNKENQNYNRKRKYNSPARDKDTI